MGDAGMNSPGMFGGNWVCTRDPSLRLKSGSGLDDAVKRIFANSTANELVIELRAS
jgi:hypothetical protein